MSVSVDVANSPHAADRQPARTLDRAAALGDDLDLEGCVPPTAAVLRGHH